MITIRDLQRILEMENEIIHDQTAGLSQADSLLQPQPGGNCLNWVVGHLLTNQLEIIDAIGGTVPFDSMIVQRYQRSSEPIRGDEEGVLALNTMVSMHDQTHQVINDKLNTMKEEDFENEIQIGERKIKLGWRVFFLHFHYTYHIGQLEFLRQMAGKLDKLI